MMEDHEDVSHGTGSPARSPAKFAPHRAPSAGSSAAVAQLRVSQGSPKRGSTQAQYRLHGVESSDSDTSSESEEEISEEEVSSSTLEAAVAAKESIERYYKNFFHALKEREDRYARQFGCCPSSSTTNESLTEIANIACKSYFSLFPLAFGAPYPFPTCFLSAHISYYLFGQYF